MATEKIMIEQMWRDFIFEIIPRVGEWSVRNFGDQKGIKHLAPLLGMLEEAGEFEDAKEYMEQVDAVIDQMIYLCDFTFRLNLSLDAAAFEGNISMPYGIPLARLAHLCLKNWQGIRGVTDERLREEAAPLVVYMFRQQFFTLLRLNMDPLIVARSIVDSVLLRNWVQKPEEGQ